MTLSIRWHVQVLLMKRIKLNKMRRYCKWNFPWKFILITHKKCYIFFILRIICSKMLFFRRRRRRKKNIERETTTKEKKSKILRFNIGIYIKYPIRHFNPMQPSSFFHFLCWWKGNSKAVSTAVSLIKYLRDYFLQFLQSNSVRTFL